MKKSILFLFALFPILASCNNNERGFVNPFPNDPYENDKIGFNFAANEIIKRTLTTSENELLDTTITNLPVINSGIIVREEGEIHERDYTRAFAGVFRDGYDASNMMYNETFVSFYQKAETEANPDPLRTRKKTTKHVDSTYDYSYGQNTSSADYKSITFLGKIHEEDSITNSEIYDEVSDYDDAVAVVEANYEIIGSTVAPPTSAKVIKKKEKSEDLLPYFYISQSITAPMSSDPIPGANAKGDVVLVKEEHKPYAETGEYVLPDGRKYRAINNSLFVTILSKATYKIGDETVDYYLVSSARTYTETVITSNVIQPNVPIDFLKKPIVINYKEEFHHFSNKLEEADKSTEDIKEIEVTE